MKKNTMNEKRDYNIYRKFFDESETIAERIERYNKLVNETAKIVKELGIRNNFDSYFYIFCYLVSNGYCSKDHHFLLGTPQNEIVGHLGLNVIDGQGLCRNIGFFMKDVFNDENLNYRIHLALTNKGNNPKNNIGFNYGINKEYIEENKKSYNHIELLANLENEYRLYDPTSFAVSSLNLSIKPNIKQVLDIESLYILNKISSKKMKEISRSIMFTRRSYIHNNEEFDFIKANALATCKKRADMLEDFHQDIKKYIITR